MAKYKPFSLLCRDRGHGEMEYQGNGNYVCPVCGLDYHDWEYDISVVTMRFGRSWSPC